MNTDLTKSGVGLMKFKRRMGEVEEVPVTHNFDYAWELISTCSMNPETTCSAQKGHIFVFLATKVASERDPLPNAGQWVVVQFSFSFQSGQ